MSMTLWAVARCQASGIAAPARLPDLAAARGIGKLARASASRARLLGFVRHKSSKGGSSKRYMARQLKDPYVKARGTDQASIGRSRSLAATQKLLDELPDHNGPRPGAPTEPAMNYVSRSAFKLLELDERSKSDKKGRGRILRPGGIVVDLGAAPGGWTQVALESQCAAVFALDLLPLDPRVRYAGSQTGRLVELTADIREPATHAALRKAILARRGDRLEGSDDSEALVHTVLSDMMANTSGNPIRDSQMSLDLIEMAFDFARRVLRPRDGRSANDVASDNAEDAEHNDKSSRSTSSSTLILKYFASPEADAFRRDVLQPAFESVASVNVKASRKESREAYLVCRDLRSSHALR